MPEKLLKIGEVARRSKKTPRAIRYYEELELISRPKRSRGGYRRYPSIVVDQIRTIQKLQNLGFELDEIRDVSITFRDLRAGREPSNKSHEILTRSVETLYQRMKSLNEVKNQIESALEFMGQCKHVEADEKSKIYFDRLFVR